MARRQRLRRGAVRQVSRTSPRHCEGSAARGAAATARAHRLDRAREAAALRRPAITAPFLVTRLGPLLDRSAGRLDAHRLGDEILRQRRDLDLLPSELLDIAKISALVFGTE